MENKSRATIQKASKEDRKENPITYFVKRILNSSFTSENESPIYNFPANKWPTTTFRYTPNKSSKSQRDSMQDLMKAIAEKPSKQKWSKSDFEIGASLGKGKFGEIYLAREKKSKIIVALKVLYKSEIIETNTEKLIEREINIQLELEHPNILGLYGFFQDRDHIFLILEYAARGELFHSIERDSRLGESLAAKYISQLTKALIYLHNKNIIHRDIKPENLLIDLSGNMKLADFGWSVKTGILNTRRATLCGTLDYLPPEMVERKEHDKSVDIWSMGVLLYEMVVGYPPFEVTTKDPEVDTSRETYSRICKAEFKIPELVSKEAKDLITKLIQYKPGSRLPLKQVLNHPFIKKYAY